MLREKFLRGVRNTCRKKEKKFIFPPESSLKLEPPEWEEFRWTEIK